MNITAKDLYKLVIPLMIEQLLSVSVGMVDTLMVSTVGEVAVSGVALVDNISRLVIQVMAAFATGGVVISSQYYGRKEIKNAKVTCAQLEVMMFFFSCITTLLFCLCNRTMLRAVFGSVEAGVMDAACIYLVITSLSYPFLGCYHAGAAIYRSIGNSKISMQVSLLMNLMNIVCNVIFVFGFKLGVPGVALATLFSRAAAGILMEWQVLSKKNPLQIAECSLYRPVKDYMLRILRIGIPSGIENGMFQIGKLVVVGMIATLGTDAIAANAIGYQIIDFPNIPGVSIGLALITITGQCIGAGDIDSAKKYTKKLVGYAYLGDWICKATLFLIAPWLVGIFSLSESATATAILILRSFCVASILVWPLSFTLPNTLRAAGDVKYTMTVSLLSMWLFRVVSSYLLAIVCNLGVMGVWIGMFIDWYARGICYLWRYKKGKWMQKKVI